jgi:hypothetical protein
MSNFDVVRLSLVNYFRMLQSRVHELIAPLPAPELWVRPYPYGNSIGNLVLHLTGNLNYYIGAQIAGTDYVRHRDLEFSETAKPKEELLRSFDEAMATVLATIAKQADSDWSAPYAAAGTENSDRFSMVLNCAGHAYHHVGQMIYLQRELRRRRND